MVIVGALRRMHEGIGRLKMRRKRRWFDEEGYLTVEDNNKKMLFRCVRRG